MRVLGAWYSLSCSMSTTQHFVRFDGPGKASCKSPFSSFDQGVILLDPSLCVDRASNRKGISMGAWVVAAFFPFHPQSPLALTQPSQPELTL